MPIRSVFRHADIAAMLRLMEHGDDLVLLSDVTAAIADGRFLEILQSAPITPIRAARRR